MYDPTCKYWDPRNELLSPGELRILQERRLRQVVQYAYAKSPFYRRKFDQSGITPDDVKTLEDISKVPLTDKYEMRDSAQRSVEAGKRPFHEFFTVPEETVVTIHSTSGTTGVPFTIGLMEQELTFRGMLASGDHAARGLWSVGLRPGDIVGHLWNLGGAMVGGGNHVIPKGACAPDLFCTVIPCHVGRTELVIKTLRDARATALICTPSYLQYIPEVAGKMGIDIRRDLRIRILVCGGEPGPASVPGLRTKLEEMWGAKAYDMYGAPAAGLATECEAQEGFHLQADGAYIQIVDPETKEELPEGKMGSIVATMLGTASFPMIRFDTEDRGALITERCSCGRTHPRLSAVPGRWDDMIKIKGFRFYPDTIEKVTRETAGCTGEFLIILDKDENQREQVTIKIEHERDVPDTAAFARDLEHAVRTLITLRANVEVVPKGSLSRWVFKSQRVIDNRSKAKKDLFTEGAKLKSAEYFD